MSEPFDLGRIQGNILRGYRRKFVRHLALAVCDRREARAWLGGAAAGTDDRFPAVTRESDQKWEVKPDLCFNIGLSFAGLRALGVGEDSLKGFPTEFVQGMNARALKLGDFGDSAPETWRDGFRKPERMHGLVSIYADDMAKIEIASKKVAGDGRPFETLDALDGHSLPDDKVHFGYTDNISQPRFAEVRDADREGDTEPLDPLGTVLLGHPTTFEGLFWNVPQPDALGLNGTFNAFRVMAQDVEGFEAYLDIAADTLLKRPEKDELLAPGWEAGFPDMTSRQAMREIVAAQMCGRWRNGRSLALSPDAPGGVESSKENAFEYPRGSRCPAGSHVRRANPRGGQIVQRVANYTRRIIRRGMVYGPDYAPGGPAAERGLLGNFIGASLGAQFEAMMCDWVNLGLQDPDITGSNDPILGANSPETSWFDLQVNSGKSIRLKGFKRFVSTRAGAYLFLPSLDAIEFLGASTN